MSCIYNSLYIWVLNVLPSIFIFYNISYYLLKSPLFSKISNILKLVISFDSVKSYTILLINIFLGNPGTCKLISDSYANNEISEYDYNLLNKVCIFMNPLFVLNIFSIKYYFLYIFSALVYIKFSSVFKNDVSYNHTYKENNKYNYSFSDFTKSINDVIYILLNVACLITFFNIIKNTMIFTFSFLKLDYFNIKYILSFLEVASGLNDIRCFSNIYLDILLISFQGICILMQSYFVLNKKNISFIRYIFSKLLTSIFITIIFLILTILFHI